jgi:DNA-directed RNA polymerase subunit M/transcription elongation factor TFIIS
MQLTKTKTFRRRSERPRQNPRRAAEPARPAETRPTMSVSQIRARRGSGPEDRALYGCECGFAWTGEVTASPSCPHCGQPQAW